ncbi:hypothetical protein PoB_005978900 [Plakobranchus ocellatus]|uniref:Uncharacterized protein n=1 Tax=Plakobranchus ocellatus TaxID=259542 RepID=A0AAV4CNF2_9GAST|nr:hypothetical protein PoB_005978900 [Plakobranchus ocellatus]
MHGRTHSKMSLVYTAHNARADARQNASCLYSTQCTGGRTAKCLLFIQRTMHGRSHGKMSPVYTAHNARSIARQNVSCLYSTQCTGGGTANVSCLYSMQCTGDRKAKCLLFIQHTMHGRTHGKMSPVYTAHTATLPVRENRNNPLRGDYDKQRV